MPTKFTEEDIKELYHQVKDLTNGFSNFNPWVLISKRTWLEIVRALNRRRLTAKELKKELELSMTLDGIRKILRIMRKDNLALRERRLIRKRLPQRCPYEWRLTKFGNKIANYSKSSFLPSQRLIIFRLLINPNPKKFAELLKRKKSVINNFETGNRKIKTIATATEYIKYIKKNFNLSKVSEDTVIKAWRDRREEIKKARLASLQKSKEFLAKAGRIGGKAGDKEKKRKNLIRQIAKQEPPSYEKKIIKLLKKLKMDFELHPILCEECFDFKVQDLVIEAENKRNMAHSYFKASRCNEKAELVKRKTLELSFVCVIPPNMHPEVAKKLSEEYTLVIYPKDKLLRRHISILDKLQTLNTFPKILRELEVNENTLRTRFKKLLEYKLIQKEDRKYINKFSLSRKGRKLLKDYKRPFKLQEILQEKRTLNQNEKVIKYLAMRYWLFTNPSGHKTVRNYLDKNEEFIKNLLNRWGIKHKSQKELEIKVGGYKITRLADEFIHPDLVLEIKSIDPSAKHAFSLAGGPVIELVGFAKMIKDFFPEYKIQAALLGKNSKIADLPEKAKEFISEDVNKVYTDNNLKELGQAG